MKLVAGRFNIIFPGNFNTKVVSSQLVIPDRLFRKLKALGITTARELLDETHTNPERIAESFGWSEWNIRQARIGLVQALERWFEPEVLYPVVYQSPLIESEPDHDSPTPENKEPE